MPGTPAGVAPWAWAFLARRVQQWNRAVRGRLEALVIARARRRWPALRAIPAPWLRPVVKPTVSRLECALARAGLAFAAVATVVMLWS
jgi:hypothetical protein